MEAAQAVLQAAEWAAERNMKITRIQLIQMIREAAAFTPKYDNNKKLKGKQRTGLPDVVQKGIISSKNEDINEDDDLENESTEIEESKMKITRTQLKELVKEIIENRKIGITPASMEESEGSDTEWSADIDLQGVESPLSQELALEDNFEDEEMFSRESLITKIVEAELRGGFKGILDFVLGQDV